MTLAVNTSPDNAISNLTDLIEELRDELDDDNYPLNKIYRAIARAEALFNRELRALKMETAVELSVTNEITDLPIDFLALRYIYQEGNPDSPLSQMSPDGLRRLYGGAAGAPCAFAIENRSVTIAPVGDTTLELTYYQRIPSLTNDNPTNWLLEEHPDVYLHQVLAILFNRQGDREAARDNQIAASGIIEQINMSANKGRWGSGPLVPLAIQQVGYVRA